jgi:hypothetical protein
MEKSVGSVESPHAVISRVLLFVGLARAQRLGVCLRFQTAGDFLPCCSSTLSTLLSLTTEGTLYLLYYLYYCLTIICGGRLVLVKKTLASMSVFAQMYSDIPVKYGTKILKISRGFLWERRNEAKGGHCKVEF